MKTGSYTDSEFVRQPPLEDHVAYNPDGSRYIPINFLEEDLDYFTWSTRSFHWQFYKDGYAKLCVSASIELVLHDWEDGNGALYERSFVGTCDFSVASNAPNSHHISTARSECVKNAASDIGRRFGRGLNDGFVPATAEATEKPKPKIKMDASIQKKFEAAVAAGDKATITLLSNIYEIKTG